MADLPLVLLHAYPFDARMWNPLRESLTARIRLITPDQRGLGRTPLPDTVREPGLADAARDLLALLDKLQLDRVVLGGCSLGGYVAMALLRIAPERVGGLVLIDTRASADSPEAARNRLVTAERAESEGIGGWLADSMLPNLLSDKAPADVTRSVRDLIESQSPSGVAWALRAMAARPDSFDVLTGLDVPTLVVVGEEDSLTPPEAARAMADALPDSELVVIAGAARLTPLEAPGAVSDAIVSWWERRFSG
ncbi:alpha/beta fold hydrolase [Amycolatopsis taiwanensis]|uniref:alpha/beta fold hydrolase n=1 Tax=Amycolatopsis taiwanensis TaxID=342230 RepID=UPI00047FB0C8|nr:alpha/beta fold hydrolase [Amycolatopsis taiwanensis]